MPVLPGMKLAVVNCSQVVTLAGPARPRVGAEMRDVGIVAPGALLVDGPRIERIGSTDEILALARCGRCIVRL